MKRRPTEIPYIPKDRRGSRYAPREGGKILRSKKGVEALRATDAGAKPGKKKIDGCGCLFILAIAWGLFSDEGFDFARDLFDRARTEITARDALPASSAEPDGPVVELAQDAAPIPPPQGARGPVADFRNLITSRDYPTESLRLGEQGTVRAQLSIDASGEATSCDVVQSSGYDRLDQRTCELLLTRARFSAAVDEGGAAIASVYVSPPIRWQIAN